MMEINPNQHLAGGRKKKLAIASDQFNKIANKNQAAKTMKKDTHCTSERACYTSKRAGRCPRG